MHFGDVDVDAGRLLEGELRAAGCDVSFHKHDVQHALEWQRIYGEISDKHGRLDILVNNAGVLDMLGPEEATEDSWHRTVDINQKSVFLGIKYGVPLLRKSTHASIINTSSIYGLIGAPDYIAYTASKGAVAAMSKAAAATYGTEGIRVNSIHPGAVDTDMMRTEFEAAGEGVEEAILDAIPLRRFAQPEEIASVVAFLASDDSSYITAAEIVIDGGLIHV